MDDHRKTKAQLVEELNALRARVEELTSCGAGTWVIDTDFVVRVADETMCVLLRKPADDVVGSKCYDLLSGPSCHTEACVLRRAFSASPREVEALRTMVERVPGDCRILARLVADRQREPVGVVQQVETAHDGARGEPRERPPALREVAPARSVLVAAPVQSTVRTDWPKTLRQAGYAVKFFEPGEPLSLSNTCCPIAAVLDLEAGRAVSDTLHQRLRKECPQTPILVVSSGDDALEARRWKRAWTWFVPRSVGPDGVVRLIEEVASRAVVPRRTPSW